MPFSTRFALADLALIGFVIGVWAYGFPHGFYTSFPGFGRTWVSVDGPFNQHLIRDTGSAYLMIGTLAGLGLLRPTAITPFGVGLPTIAFNALHLAYHITHLGMYGPLDQVLNVVALGSVTLASGWLMMPTQHRPQANER